MNETTKESKFLDAINQYAEKQKAMIGRELEDYKSRRIEQATESGLTDAYELIRRDIAQRKNAIVTEYAQKEYALRRDLFGERQRITDEVFAAAVEKLNEYAGTDAYRAALAASAEKAVAMCEGHPYVILLCKRDLALKDSLADAIGNGQIQEDASIMIGGVKVLCNDLGILIDDTLDSKLSEERGRFTAYSGLKVV